ncbi:ABC transporter permease [Rubinisphaera margarita]|uniref:ABC transporter permease n=1 Tax=Rubinisphaera margarita TaxID=2909586 RepID=UPI001EE9AB4B|nr:hypothetical protein [Rubinisphaera margarita]MCG6154864.1 hypothetical protein [Rubinisphaera margarita]
MSVLQIPDSRLESFSDRMNPILVKETRQALKSRAFVATFMLLLIASWLICIFGTTMSGQNLEYGTPGREFFQAFYVVLSAAVLVIVPFTAYLSLLTEQNAQTYELLSITSLTPRQIVLGKLSNSIVQILVYYCAIAPFIAFTSLLQGFDLVSMVVLLVILLATSILLCTFTLMLSTVASNRQVQTLSSLFIMGGLATAFISILMLSFASMQQNVLSDPDFVAGMICFFVMGASYFLLFLQITISQLMYEAGNKSTGVRLIGTGQSLLAWGLMIATAFFFGGGIDDEVFTTVCILSLIHWAAFGFFISMERDYLSRRIRRELPQRVALRMLLVPFMPGGTRGYLLLLINLGIVLAFALVTMPMVSGLGVNEFQAILVVMLYIVAYLGLGAFMSRNLLKVSTELKPMHARTLLVVIFAFGAIVPYMILAAVGYYDRSGAGYHILQITDPISTLNEVDQGRNPAIISLLSFAAIVGVLANLLPMIVATREIVSPDRPSPEMWEEPGEPIVVAESPIVDATTPVE